MKKVLLFFALFYAFTAQAQVDTVKGGILIKPVLVNYMTKDSAYQMTVNVFDLKLNDTTQGCNSYVVLYSRKASQVQAMNVPIPKQVVNAWGTSDKAVEDFILASLGLTRK